MKIVAGIVLYNPEINRLIENLNSIYNQVDSIIIIDNASKNIDKIKKILINYNNIKIIENDKNYGIAKALNQIMKYAIENNAKWALTLDQDSVCNDGLIENYKKNLHFNNIGILTCNIIDRNFKEYNNQEKNWRSKCVKYCITSASLVNIEAYKECGGFDEKMFIDKVDFDICLSMQERNYKILKINFNGLLHEVGRGKNVSFMGKKYIVYNHSYLRKYYIARNAVYMARKHKETLSLSREIIRELRDMLLVILYEDKKIIKTIFSIKGLIEGFFIKVDRELTYI